jgi:hypothetical protein
LLTNTELLQNLSTDLVDHEIVYLVTSLYYSFFLGRVLFLNDFDYLGSWIYAKVSYDQCVTNFLCYSHDNLISNSIQLVHYIQYSYYVLRITDTITK